MSSETASKKYEHYKRRKNPVKHGDANRKARGLLDGRVSDYYRMLDSAKDPTVYLGYRKPGSMQGPR